MNMFYNINLSLNLLKENERSKLLYFLDAVKVAPEKAKIFAEFLEEQSEYHNYGTTPPVSNSYKQIIEYFKTTQDAVGDEKKLRECLR